MSDTGTALITGATSGIGAETARKLLDRGWTVYVHGRNQQRGQAIVDDDTDTPGAATFLQADFTERDGVTDLAEAVQDQTEELTALVHNAGVYVDECRTAWDGVEEMFAVNHLAPYLLTHELTDLIRHASPTRVVFSSSTMHTRGEFDFDAPSDLDCSTELGSRDLYGRSKLADLTFATELEDRFADDAVVTAIHPGFVAGGDIYRNLGPLARSVITVAAYLPFVGTSVEDAATSMVHHITGTVSGTRSHTYFEGTEPTDPDPRVADPDNRALVWSLSAEVTGVDPDWP